MDIRTDKIMPRELIEIVENEKSSIGMRKIAKSDKKQRTKEGESITN